MRECREALQQAIEVRKFYYEKIEVISRGDPAKLEQVEGDIAPFEEDLRSVLEVRDRRELGGRRERASLIHTTHHGRGNCRAMLLERRGRRLLG